jgi:hypothetical protein
MPSTSAYGPLHWAPDAVPPVPLASLRDVLTQLGPSYNRAGGRCGLRHGTGHQGAIDPLRARRWYVRPVPQRGATELTSESPAAFDPSPKQIEAATKLGTPCTP